MSSPVRVLWLVKGLGRGGTERLLTAAAPHVDRDRFEVEVAYVLPHKQQLVGDLRRYGVPVHCLGSGAIAPALGLGSGAIAPALGLGWVLRLRRLVAAGRFSLIHTHSPVPAVAARVVLGSGRVLTHTEHNVWKRYRLPTYLANTATFGRNAAAIAVSEGVADSMVPPRWMPWVRMPEVHMLHHGIDEAAVRRGAQAKAAARRRLGLRSEDLVVGTVGNFSPKKDQHALLTAFESVFDEHPRARLVLIGSGPLEQELRRRVDRTGLGDRVMFTGIRDDVQELLPGMDVFTLSSVHEGLSIALLEAMAAGVPCVCTRVGGVPEAITDGREGFLTQPRDPAALASAISKLLGDEALRADMGEEAATTAQRFSIGHAVRRTEEIYDAVLALR